MKCFESGAWAVGVTKFGAVAGPSAFAARTVSVLACGWKFDGVSERWPPGRLAKVGLRRFTPSPPEDPMTEARMALAELLQKVARRTSADFLHRLVAAVPYKVHA